MAVYTKYQSYFFSAEKRAMELMYPPLGLEQCCELSEPIPDSFWIPLLARNFPLPE